MGHGEALGHDVLVHHDVVGALGHGVLGHEAEDVLDHDEVLDLHEDVLGHGVLAGETFSVALFSLLCTR